MSGTKIQIRGNPESDGEHGDPHWYDVGVTADRRLMVDSNGGGVGLTEPVEVEDGGNSLTVDSDAGALDVSDANLPDYTGTWAYAAGAAATVNVPAGGRVLGISAVGGAGGGTLTIDGGDSIPVPEDVAVTINPEGNLVAPEVVFAGTSSYVVDWVTA